MRRIICKNGSNKLVFGETYSPFVLTDCEGLYEVSSDNNYSDNGMLDGATYVGAKLRVRNIVLTVKDKSEHGSNRNLLYNVFKPKTLSTLTYEESDNGFEVKRSIDYYVESIVNNGSGSGNRTTTISLLCLDPNFSDTSYTNVTMTGWDSKFTFPHVFKSEEFASKIKEKLISFNNESTIDKLGMQITLKAEGSVKNPKILSISDDSYIQLGTDSKPLNLIYGDEVEIYTETNNKNVYLIRDGVKSNINEYIEEGSKYIQLVAGENVIRYFAKDGEDNLLVSIRFKCKFIGV